MALLRVIALAVLAALPAAAADRPLDVGILPFDVVNISGASRQTSESLAKLVRVEMIRNQKLRPKLIELPEGTRMPIPVDQLGQLGTSAEADVVLVGTVIDATTSYSQKGANTGGMFGIGVGGRVSRSNAKVLLHLEMIEPGTGKVLDSFEVEGSASGTGIGTDVNTALGGVNTGGQADAPMNKALREAAQKVVAELTKRAGKVKPRPQPQP